MIQRIRQFYRAMTAVVDESDRDFIAHSIPQAAQLLFYQMHPADQAHALHVARTALQLADASNLTIDRSMLLRCALLHDVGRVKGDLDIWGKVFAVLITHFTPRLAHRLACANCHCLWDKPGYAVFVYFHHPEIGAKKLRAIGLEDEAAIISCHHQPASGNDSPILAILREADERN